MTDYAKRLKIPLDGGILDFFSPSRHLIATGYNRIVIGGRGPYIEFEAQHFAPRAIRLTPVRHYYYEEWRTDPDGIMVYHQSRLVNYADYLIDRFYISPFDLATADGNIIEPLKPKQMTLW
jgi:hypothetical protein